MLGVSQDIPRGAVLAEHDRRMAFWRAEGEMDTLGERDE